MEPPYAGLRLVQLLLAAFGTNYLPLIVQLRDSDG
jgi:hypothetical protein